MKLQLKESVPLGTRKRSAEGYLHADAKITRSVVSEYTRGELGMDGDPFEVIGIYRSPESVFDDQTLASAANKPILLNQHEMQDASTVRGQMVGVTGADVRKNKDFLVAPVSLFDKDAVEQVEAGYDQVSMGYYVDTERKEGIVNGKRYDYITVGPIEVNHLALVHKGRLGKDARILDSATNEKLLSQLTDANAATKKLEADLKELQDKLNKQLSDAEGATKKLEEAQEATEAAEASLKDAQAANALLVRVRALLPAEAKEGSFSTESDVLKAVLGDNAPADKSDDYLRALVDAKLAAADKDADRRKAAKDQRKAVATDDKDKPLTDAEQAYAHFENAAANAWNTPIKFEGEVKA